MNIETIQSVYFVGAGGIGMSALVRYFLSKGKVVAGYDRTPSELTQHLIEEGAQIHYEENIDLIPEACKDKATTLVVLTPAVPQEHAELTYFRDNGFYLNDDSPLVSSITCRLYCFSGRYFQKLRNESTTLFNQPLYGD